MNVIIKSKKTWKDLVENSNHPTMTRSTMTRREMLVRGLATGAMSVGVSKLIAGDLIKQAWAAGPMNCPPPVTNPGSIAQIFSEGGPTMGARFISEQQASMMSAGMAANYGISGQANLLKLGPNMVIDRTSAFGFTLLQGPPGYTGGPAAWQANVLSKISGGAHLGPFNADDGAGSNTGLLGGVSPFKTSQMGKDLKINVSNALATWANGLPASSVSGNGLAPARLAQTFSLTPAAAGLVNAGSMSAASDAANALAQAFSSLFGTNSRKASQQLMTNAGCAFYGNSALSDPSYGLTLFTPANIAALSSRMTVANLTAAEQAQIAAFYQSAVGVAGGVILQFNGRDYHNNNPATDIGPKDIEEARTIVMWLAACEAAQARGAMIYFSNGQAIASGVQSMTATINGVASTMNAPVAQGDAGGSYNAGLVIFYDPKGSPPAARFTGTVTAASGNAKTDGNVGSSKEAVAGLYLSALSWVNNGTIPQSALSAMRAAGVAANPTKITVI